MTESTQHFKNYIFKSRPDFQNFRKLLPSKIFGYMIGNLILSHLWMLPGTGRRLKSMSLIITHSGSHILL